MKARIDVIYHLDVTEATVTFAIREARLLEGLLLEIRTRNEPAQRESDREMLSSIEDLRTRFMDSYETARDSDSDTVGVRLDKQEARLLHELISASGPMYGSNPSPVELGNLVILAKARDRLNEVL
jgi:hypothetical protein